jgi:Protein kinase domain/WD40-like Beta Propeller Repeat
MARAIEPNMGELSTQTDGSGLQRNAAASTKPLPGTIDRYRVERVLGAGGMGVVFAAYDPELARPVALKLISPGATGEDTIGRATRRLLREAQAMARVSHPNVVAVYDVGVVEGQVFVAMELVEGKTLSAWLAERTRPWEEILAAFLDAARGLAAAHAAGLVHRDFKPDNVMVGNDGRVRVLDFGLARPADIDLPAPTSMDGTADTLPDGAMRVTLTHGVAGTPLFMAPEQYQPGAGVDHRVDQFALCVALYRAIYRQHPFGEGGLERLRQAIVRGELRPTPRGTRVPRHIDAALRRGMRPDRNARFPNMEALMAALARPPRLRARALLVGLGLLTGVAAAIAVGLSLRGGTVPPPPPARAFAQQQLTWLGDVEAPTFSPDGKQLAFIGSAGVYVRDLASGADRVVAPGTFHRYLEWLPGGAGLLTTSTNGRLVEIALADGTSREPLGDWRMAYVAVLGHDTVAISSMPAKGFTVAKFGAPPQKTRRCSLDVGQMWNFGISASPARDRVAMAVMNQKHELSLWTEKTDCSEQHQLVAVLEQPGDPIAMRWVTVGGKPALYLMLSAHLRGTVVRIPLTPEGTRAGPTEVLARDLDVADGLAIGPRGELAYVHSDHSSNLWWLVREPAAQRPLTSGTAQRGNAVRSPDGQLLAFEERAGPRLRLAVLHLPDGRERATFELPSEANVMGVAWSPDGDALLLNLVTRGEAVLWIYPLEGGTPRRIEGVQPSADAGSLAWAPDGRLVYPVPGNTNFAWLTLDGHDQGVLAQKPYLGWMFAPTFTPDGAFAAVYWNRYPAPGIYLLATGTGESRKLFDDDKEAFSEPLVWSADGRWVYVVTVKEAADETIDRIRRVPREGGLPEEWWKPPLDGHVYGLALSADGNTGVATVSHDERDLYLIEP